MSILPGSDRRRKKWEELHDGLLFFLQGGRTLLEGGSRPGGLNMDEVVVWGAVYQTGNNMFYQGPLHDR